MTSSTTFPATGVHPGPGVVTVQDDAVVVAPAPGAAAELLAVVVGAGDAAPSVLADQLAIHLAARSGVGIVVRTGRWWVLAAGPGLRVRCDLVGHRLSRDGPVGIAVDGPVGMGLLPPGADVVPVRPSQVGTVEGLGVWIQTETVLGVPGPPVEGVLCPCGAFGHPDTLICGSCGQVLRPPRRVHVDVPVPVARVVLDDGRAMPLVGAVVMGRDPTDHPQVRAGDAGTLVLTDSQRSVSRAHVTLTVDGWDVVLQDDGSANGTEVRPPASGEWTALVPRVPVRLLPGSDVHVGRRSFRVL